MKSSQIHPDPVGTGIPTASEWPRGLGLQMMIDFSRVRGYDGKVLLEELVAVCLLVMCVLL